MLWFETVIYYHFKIAFGPSSFYVLMDTNPDEVGEFISLFIDRTTIILSLFYIIPLLFLKNLVNELNLLILRLNLIMRHSLVVLLLAILGMVFLRLTKLTDHNLFYLTVRSVVAYSNEMSAIKNFNEAFIKQGITVKHNDAIDKCTYVVIVGESTTRNHMSLYGYYRETTPFMTARKDSLNIYNNLISSSTYTFKSLSKSLSLGNYEYPEKQLAMPSTELFNKVGFKTYWISNHSPVFNPSSLLTRISNQARIIHYNTKEKIQHTVKHDGELLPKLKEALNAPDEKKIIFLHLIGTHFEYENRYPSAFNYFKDKPKTKFNSNIAFEAINKYDNAIRYNDFIVNQVINEVKQVNGESFVMYFSDHGEEVFQEAEFFGHFEDKPTKNSFEIPFFMWYSENFTYPEDFVYKSDLAYMTDDLWHSIAHISNIESELIEKERSLFSKHFKPRKRVVLENKDFDLLYNE